MSDDSGFWGGLEWISGAVMWLRVHPLLVKLAVIWALCAFVAWAAQRATIRRVRAANAMASEGVRLMEPVPWPMWAIVSPPTAPVAAIVWLVKWGVILWGTLSFEVDPDLRARFFAHLGGSPPPDT